MLSGTLTQKCLTIAGLVILEVILTVARKKGISIQLPSNLNSL